jgi:uncharacterized membrane protein
MVSALLALVGLLISAYLWFWKIGALGALACGDGACERVQLSPYAYLLGIPVAFFGVAGYLAILVVGLLGVQDRFATARWPTHAITALAGVGVAFSAYLTYLEAVVIQAWCRWCIVSALIIVAIFVTGLMGEKAAKRLGG